MKTRLLSRGIVGLMFTSSLIAGHDWEIDGVDGLPYLTGKKQEIHMKFYSGVSWNRRR